MYTWVSSAIHRLHNVCRVSETYVYVGFCRGRDRVTTLVRGPRGCQGDDLLEAPAASRGTGQPAVDLPPQSDGHTNDGALCDVRTPRRQRCSKKLSFMHR